MERLASRLGASGLLLLVLWYGSNGCDQTEKKPLVETGSKKQEVEVAPGKWITIELASSDAKLNVGKGVSMDLPLAGDTGSTRLAIPWDDRTVVWEGNPVPFCLREWKGKLYIIGFDRTDLEKCRFKYYRQKDDGFVPIPPDAFPKRIATQNMWINVDDSYRDPEGRMTYDLQVLRSLDVDFVCFKRSLTALVWSHLAEGKDAYENAGEANEVATRAFKKRYDPIALPTIIRTPPGWPDGGSANHNDKKGD